MMWNNSGGLLHRFRVTALSASLCCAPRSQTKVSKVCGYFSRRYLLAAVALTAAAVGVDESRAETIYQTGNEPSKEFPTNGRRTER